LSKNKPYENKSFFLLQSLHEKEQKSDIQIEREESNFNE
jgi:hypothetical protein